MFKLLKKTIEEKYEKLSNELDNEVHKIFYEYNKFRGKNNNKSMCLNISINGYDTFNIYELSSTLWISFKTHDTITLYGSLRITDRLEIYKQIKKQL
jgi:hypothetical protein